MHNLNKTIAFGIVALLIFPVLFVYFSSGFLNYLSVRGFLSSLGSILGLVGAILLSLGIILSVKTRFADKYLKGLGGLYDIHSKIAQIGFSLVLLHPIFLLAKYAYDVESAFKFLTLNGNIVHDLGFLAVWFFILTIVSTLYISLKYDFWRFIHRFSSGAILLATLHVFLSPSYIFEKSPFLFYYTMTFMSLASLSWIYFAFLQNLGTKKYKYQVTEVIKKSPEIAEFKAAPLADKIPYQAGQYAFLKFKEKGIEKQPHPFSFTSCPQRQDISFAFKVFGGFTSKLYEKLSPGMIFEVFGPFGEFSYKKASSKKQIWIAGGIGITPFLSMLCELENSASGADYEIELFYCVKNESEAVFLSELEQVNYPKFKLFAHYSDKQGFITTDYIKNKTSIKDKDFLICGPSAMTESLKKQLTENKVPDEKIYFELFSI